jgi:serine beta-lactamase-like protein LACTB, mitochondrial
VIRLVLLALALPATAALAQSAPKQLDAKTAAAVDAAVAAEIKRQGYVGAALGVIRDGEVVYLKGYGLADREKKVPVTTDTVFNWASNSKPLAAVAAVQLSEKKLLDLDADVRQYVPEFPEKSAVITTRHLLTHQSGIPHYANGKVVPTAKKYAAADPFRDPVLALDKFSGSPLLFKPSEKTSYSTYAYILLSSVVQRAGKEAFNDQIDRRIAKPLGLKSLQLDFETRDQAHWAAAYVKGPAGAVVPAKDEANYWKHGGGGYKSNVADFARWAAGLIGRKLMSEKTEALMWTPVSLAGGEKTKWGLGFTVEDQGGLKVSHNGRQPETSTRLVLYPRARHGLVFMTNCGFGDVGAVTTAVYKALDGK